MVNEIDTYGPQGYLIIDKGYEGVIPSEKIKQKNEEMIKQISDTSFDHFLPDEFFTYDDAGNWTLKTEFEGHISEEVVEAFQGKEHSETEDTWIFIGSEPITIDNTTGKIQYNLFIVNNPDLNDEEGDVGYLGEIPNVLLPNNGKGLHNKRSNKTGNANNNVAETLDK